MKSNSLRISMYIIGTLLVVVLGITGCSDNPYTGSMMQPGDLDKYLSDQGGGKICLLNGTDSACVTLYPKRGDQLLPIIHIHPSKTTYLFYYQGHLIMQAERPSDNTDLIDDMKGDGQDESDGGPRDDVGGGQQVPGNIGGGQTPGGQTPNNDGGTDGGNNGGGTDGGNNGGGTDGGNNGNTNNGGNNGNTNNGGNNGNTNNGGNNGNTNNGGNNGNTNNGGNNGNTNNGGNNGNTNNGGNNGNTNNGGNNNNDNNDNDNNGGGTPGNPNPSGHNPPDNVLSHLVYGHDGDDPVDPVHVDGWIVWIYYPHNYVEQGHPRGLGMNPINPQTGPASVDDPITPNVTEVYGFTFSVTGGEVKNFSQTAGECTDELIGSPPALNSVVDNRAAGQDNRDDWDDTPCSSSGSDYSTQMFVKSSAEMISITIRWTHGMYAPNSQTFNIMQEVSMRQYDSTPPPDRGHTNQERWD